MWDVKQAPLCLAVLLQRCLFKRTNASKFIYLEFFMLLTVPPFLRRKETTMDNVLLSTGTFPLWTFCIMGLAAKPQTKQYTDNKI